MEDDLEMIMDIVDGCSAQYKCGTALYLLANFATKHGKIYYRCVKCAGHGKCRCDAEGGRLKTFLDRIFDYFVNDPENEMTNGDVGAPSHKVEDGVMLSLAHTAFGLLNNKEVKGGAKSHSARKAREAKKVIKERRFTLRHPDQAKHAKILKMKACGFEKGEHMGMRAYSNFVADHKIGLHVMARRVGCLCKGCSAQMGKATPEERYENPCDDCEYWEMYKISENGGMNDWIKISFDPKKGVRRGRLP